MEGSWECDEEEEVKKLEKKPHTQQRCGIGNHIKLKTSDYVEIFIIVTIS